MYTLHQHHSRDHEQAICAESQIDTVLGKLWSALKSAFAALAARKRPKHSSATVRPFTAQGDHDEVLEGSFYMKDPIEKIK